MKCRNKMKKQFIVNDSGQIKNVNPVLSERTKAMVDMLDVLSTLEAIDEHLDEIPEEVNEEDGQVPDQI